MCCNSNNKIQFGARNHLTILNEAFKTGDVEMDDIPLS